MKEKGKLKCLLLVLCFGLLMIAMGHTMRLAAADGDEENTVAAVKPVSIHYDELWIEVDPGDNTVVYYSDKAQKVWTEAVMEENDEGNIKIDISWLKATTATEITLKGDKNEEVVSVALPARVSTYKIKFDKVNGVLTFTGVSEAASIEWRKATSYVWSDPVSVKDAGDPTSDFAKEIEALRVAGASIYVRVCAVDGATTDGNFNVGSRPGKEVKLSITKRAAAPKIKINGSKLTLNTTTSMQYSIDGEVWEVASKTMSVADVAPQTLGAGATSAVLFFRKKATTTAPYSKTFMLEIPAQPEAPTTAQVSGESKDGKYYLTFKDASKTNQYEYAVVKTGDLDVTKASWKSVITAKIISISAKTAPADSKIYVRRKTVATPFALASDVLEITVTYSE